MLTSWGMLQAGERCPHGCRQLLSRQSWQSCFAWLCPANTCPAPAPPGAVTALRSTARWYPAASRQLRSAPWAGRRGKRQPGSHTALSLPRAHTQATRRSGGSPGHPAALHQGPDEGALPPQGSECPSCLCSAPRCCSSPASGASLLTFCSLPLAQVTTLRASSLERLVEGQAKVRIVQGSILAIPPLSHTWPGAAAAHRGPLLLRGCSVSTVPFLQAGAEQRPPPVPAGGKGGHGPSAGEFGEERGRTAFLSSSGRRALVLQWGCCPSPQGTSVPIAPCRR